MTCAFCTAPAERYLPRTGQRACLACAQAHPERWHWRPLYWERRGLL